jgi:hypothetical protein
MNERIIRKLAARPDPHAAIRRQTVARARRLGIADTELDRDVVSTLRSEGRRAQILPVGEPFRIGRVRHRLLVRDALRGMRDARRSAGSRLALGSP